LQVVGGWISSVADFQSTNHGYNTGCSDSVSGHGFMMPYLQFQFAKVDSTNIDTWISLRTNSLILKIWQFGLRNRSNKSDEAMSANVVGVWADFYREPNFFDVNDP
jgi:hypothetical protein